MSTPTHASPPEFRRFWARWIAVTFGGALAALLPTLGWVLFTLFAQAPYAALAAIPWFFLGFGLLAGAGQAWLLRPWLARGALWAVGSALALFLASHLTYAVSNAYFAMPAYDGPFALSVLLHFGQGAVLGAALGLAQFPFLPRTRHARWWWLLANILIWAVADGLGTVISGPGDSDASEARWLANFFLMPLLAAVAGGAAMAWLLGLPGRRLSFIALAGALVVAVAGPAQAGAWVLALVQDQPGQQFGEEFVARRPAWSPDGRQVAFAWGGQYGEARLFIAPAAGGPAVPRSDYHDALLFVWWTPDGGAVCYGNYAQTFIAAAAPGQAAALTACRTTETRSPDGRWTVRVGPDRDNFHVRGPDGAEQVLEVEKPDQLSWSPDSRRLLYRTFRNGNYEVYLIDLDTAVETNLSASPGHDSQPQWLPGGDEIIFESDRDGARNLYVLRLADGSLRQLTANTNPSLSFYGLALAPNADQLVYHTYWFDVTGETVSDFAGPHLMRLDGTERIALPEQDQDEFWEWSPDGSALLTARQGRLWLINADGTGLRQFEFTLDE